MAVTAASAAEYQAASGRPDATMQRTSAVNTAPSVAGSLHCWQRKSSCVGIPKRDECQQRSSSTAYRTLSRCVVAEQAKCTFPRAAAQAAADPRMRGA